MAGVRARSARPTTCAPWGGSPSSTRDSRCPATASGSSILPDALARSPSTTTTGCTRTLDTLGSEGRSGYDISLALFPDALAPSLRRFAVAETLAHLEHLVFAGRAARVTEGGHTAYATVP